jgi:hypothetical protein
MWEAVVVAIMVALLAVLGLSKVRYYRRMFSEDHFREFHGALAVAIRSATQDPGADERTRFITRAGLGAAVTFSSPREGRYALHISLSQPGRMTTHAVSSHFGAFIVAMLQGNNAELTPYFTNTGVRHFPFQIAAPTATVQDFESSYSAYRQFLRERKPLPFEYRSIETAETTPAGTAPPGTGR